VRCGEKLLWHDVIPLKSKHGRLGKERIKGPRQGESYCLRWVDILLSLFCSYMDCNFLLRPTFGAACVAAALTLDSQQFSMIYVVHTALRYKTCSYYRTIWMT
jgi:hypothetical protein